MHSILPTILEKAVLNSCRRELMRLQQEKRKNTLISSIEAALRELGKLKEGKKPIYRFSMVPLLHASWYHLAHVNFCIKTVSDLIKEPVHSGESVGILDFGCGTMPLQWAVAVAVADMVKDQMQIPDIHVVNIDESEKMSNLGCDMWTELKNLVQSDKNNELRPLAGVMQKMKMPVLNSTGSLSAVLPSGQKLHLVTAIHAVYENVDVLRQKHIEKIIEGFPIPPIWFTTNERAGGKMLETDRMSKKFQPGDMKLTWPGRVAKDLTSFRQDTLLHFCGQNADNLTEKFLKGEVTWQPANPVGILM